jgi:hypothetical protein
MKRAILKWVALAGAIGFAVPMLLILSWKLFGLDFWQSNATPWVWPSSILLMGLDGPTPRSNLEITGIYALLIAENVLLYSILGLAISVVAYSWRLRRNR